MRATSGVSRQRNRLCKRSTSNMVCNNSWSTVRTRRERQASNRSHFPSRQLLASKFYDTKMVKLSVNSIGKCYLEQATPFLVAICLGKWFHVFIFVTWPDVEVKQASRPQF